MDDYQLLVIFSDDVAHSQRVHRIEDAYYIDHFKDIFFRICWS